MFEENAGLISIDMGGGVLAPANLTLYHACRVGWWWRPAMVNIPPSARLSYVHSYVHLTQSDITAFPHAVPLVEYMYFKAGVVDGYIIQLAKLFRSCFSKFRVTARE